MQSTVACAVANFVRICHDGCEISRVLDGRGCISTVATITDKCVGSSSRIQPPCPCFQPLRVSKLGCTMFGPRKIAVCEAWLVPMNIYRRRSVARHTSRQRRGDVTRRTGCSKGIVSSPANRVNDRSAYVDKYQPEISRFDAGFMGNYN